MSIITTILGLLGGNKGKISDLLSMKKQASDLMDQHGDKLDAVTDKIPGTKDDQLVDQAKDLLK